jgi:hypothetical protein
VPHLLRHGTSIFKVISERPVILTSGCNALDEEAITTYFKRLRFDAAGTSWLELTTSRMLSESTTTRLPQLVMVLRSFCVYLHFSASMVLKIFPIINTYINGFPIMVSPYPRGP